MNMIEVHTNQHLFKQTISGNVFQMIVYSFPILEFASTDSGTYLSVGR